MLENLHLPLTTNKNEAKGAFIETDALLCAGHSPSLFEGRTKKRMLVRVTQVQTAPFGKMF